MGKRKQVMIAARNRKKAKSHNARIVWYGCDWIGQFGPVWICSHEEQYVKKLELDGVKDKDKIISKLKELTKDRTPKLDITISPY